MLKVALSVAALACQVALGSGSRSPDVTRLSLWDGEVRCRFGWVLQTKRKMLASNDVDRFGGKRGTEANWSCSATESLTSLPYKEVEMLDDKVEAGAAPNGGRWGEDHQMRVVKSSEVVRGEVHVSHHIMSSHCRANRLSQPSIGPRATCAGSYDLIRKGHGANRPLQEGWG